MIKRGRKNLSHVAAFDALKGDFASTAPHPCGSPVGLVYTYAVTFHWPGHTLVVDPGQALCGVGRRLTLDGSHLPQTLQDDSELDNTHPRCSSRALIAATRSA